MVLLWTYFSPLKRGPNPISRRNIRFGVYSLLVCESIRHALKCISSVVVYNRPNKYDLPESLSNKFQTVRRLAKY